MGGSDRGHIKISSIGLAHCMGFMNRSSDDYGSLWFIGDRSLYICSGQVLFHHSYAYRANWISLIIFFGKFLEVLISCISFNIYWPKKYQTQSFRIFHNLRSGVISFFASVAREGKNNAWYIYLTSSQPPPNLHNLTFAWPVMFLANKRLPYGNQILARIMSLLKSVLGKKKF